MSERTLNKKVKELKELESQIKELEEQAEAIKDKIKAELTKREVEELDTGNYIIRFKKFISNRFDSSRFKTDHAELYKEYIKPSECLRFSIS